MMHNSCSQQDADLHSEHYLRYREIILPFAGMSEAEIVEYAKSIEEVFDRTFEQLQERILTVDPLALLSSFALYGLTSSDDEGRELTEEEPILQADVEFLQALVLQYKLERFEPRAILPPDFEEFRSLVKLVRESFHMRRLAALGSSASLQDRQRDGILESIRTHTQTVRNIMGYGTQIMHIVAELFAPIDKDLEDRTGVRIAYLIDMWDKLRIISQDGDHFKPGARRFS